jgi:hypothetical protein
LKRVEFIQHQWRQVLLLDFSQCSVEEALNTIEEAKKVIRSQPEKSLLILTDVTDARYNIDVVEKLKEFTKGNEPYVRASAVVGLDGIKKIIYNAVVMFSKRTFPLFENRENALDWLIDN